MPVVDTRRWTAHEVRALPDEPGLRFECVDGELLVSPSPSLSRQWAVAALFRALDAYCRAGDIGAVGMAPGDLQLDEATLVQPDLFVLPLVASVVLCHRRTSVARCWWWRCSHLAPRAMIGW